MITRPQLYNMFQINEFNDHWKQGYDYFFVAAGSDYRAYEVLRKFAVNNISIGTIVLFEFEERLLETSDTYFEIHELGFNIVKIPCSIFDPSSSSRRLNEIKIDIHENSRIAIDISCFTKPYFAFIIKYLQLKKLKIVTAFYTEPMSYRFPTGLYESYSSTGGTLEVIEIPGFPGEETGVGEYILIIMFGFEGKLADFIERSVSYDKIILVNGFPAYSPSFKDISLINNDPLIRNKALLPIRYACANNPFDTYNLLEDILENHSGSNISIAALGTKPMALGACLFAVHNPSVRLVYPLPEKYSNITTNDCCMSWGYILPLL